VTLINSSWLPRVSVIRSLASWFGKCDCPSKSLRAAESQWHKDGRLLSREDERLLGSSSTTSSRRDGPPSNIHELPNAGSPPRPRRPPPRLESPTLPTSSSLYPLPPSPLPSFLPPSSLPPAATSLPLLALSSPNGRAASILTSALRIYFGPVP